MSKLPRTVPYTVDFWEAEKIRLGEINKLWFKILQPTDQNMQLAQTVSSTDLSKIGKYNWTRMNEDKTRVLAQDIPFNMPASVGDTIWLREPWGIVTPTGSYVYDRDFSDYHVDGHIRDGYSVVYPTQEMPKSYKSWTRSAHRMPHWASRTQLLITKAEVKHVQELSEEQLSGIIGLKRSILLPLSTYFRENWNEKHRKRNEYATNPYVLVVDVQLPGANV